MKGGFTAGLEGECLAPSNDLLIVAVLTLYNDGRAHSPLACAEAKCQAMNPGQIRAESLRWSCIIGVA